MTVSFDTVPANAAASAVFIEQANVRRAVGAGIIPHKILLLGQYNADKTPDTDLIQPLLSVAQANVKYGRGSMLALMATACFRTNGAVEVFAAAMDDDLAANAASGDIVVTGTASSNGTLSLYFAGVRVRVGVTSGDTAATVATAIRNAINANLDLPVTASIDTATLTQVDYTCRWAGASGNSITVVQNLFESEELEVPGTTSLAITAMAGGTADPDIMPALDLMGDVRYTVLACPYAGDDAYNALRLKGDELAGPIEKRPFISFVGYTGDRADLLTLLDSRNSQWVSIMPVAESVTMPLEIAGVVAGAVARSAQTDPGRPSRTLELIGVRGATEYWSWEDRDAVVRAGGSTTLTDSAGTVRIEDAVTTYTTDPDTSDNDAWRFVETVTNIQNKVYQLNQVFSASPFSRSIVVDDNSTTQKSYAVRPRSAKAFAIALVDVWVAEAWSRERDAIIAGIEAEINSGNAGRIDIIIPDVIAAGGKIVAVRYEWAFQPPQVN
jgi:phage tail sheath gpL-like